MRFLLKALLRGLVILLALPLLLGLLLASDSVNRWLFEQADNQLPQLSLAFEQGNLAVVADGLGPGERLVVDDLPAAIAGMALDPRRDEALEARVAEQALGQRHEEARP